MFYFGELHHSAWLALICAMPHRKRSNLKSISVNAKKNMAHERSKITSNNNIYYIAYLDSKTLRYKTVKSDRNQSSNN